MVAMSLSRSLFPYSKIYHSKIFIRFDPRSNTKVLNFICIMQYGRSNIRNLSIRWVGSDIDTVQDVHIHFFLLYNYVTGHLSQQPPSLHSSHVLLLDLTCCIFGCYINLIFNFKSVKQIWRMNFFFLGGIAYACIHMHRLVDSVILIINFVFPKSWRNHPKNIKLFSEPLKMLHFALLPSNHDKKGDCTDSLWMNVRINFHHNYSTSSILKKSITYLESVPRTNVYMKVVTLAMSLHNQSG